MSEQTLIELIAKYLDELEYNQLELFKVILCQMQPPLRDGIIKLEELQGKSVDHIASIIVKRHTTRHASRTVEKILTEMKELNTRMNFKKEIRNGSKHKKKMEASGPSDVTAIINNLFGDDLRRLASATEDNLTQNQVAPSSSLYYPPTFDDSEEGSASEDDSPQSQASSSPLSPVCPKTPATESSQDGSDLEVAESEEEEVDERPKKEGRQAKIRMSSNQYEQSMLTVQESYDLPGCSSYHETASEMSPHKRKRKEQTQDMIVKATGDKMCRIDKNHKNLEKNNGAKMSSNQSVQKVKKTPDSVHISRHLVRYSEAANKREKHQRTPGQQIQAESEEEEMDEEPMSEGRRVKRRLSSSQSEERMPIEAESCDTQGPTQCHTTANKIRAHTIKKGRMKDMDLKVTGDQIGRMDKKPKHVEKKHGLTPKPNQSAQEVKQLPFASYRIPKLSKSNEAGNKMESCKREPGQQIQAESDEDEMDDERINEVKRLNFNQSEQSMLIEPESCDIRRPSHGQKATKEIRAHGRKQEKQMQAPPQVIRDETGNHEYRVDENNVGRKDIPRPSCNQLVRTQRIQPKTSPMTKPILYNDTGNNKEAHQRNLEEQTHDTADSGAENQDYRRDKKEKKEVRGNDGAKRNSNQSAPTLMTQSYASPRPSQCNSTGSKGEHETKQRQEIKDLNDSLAGNHTPKRSDERRHVNKRSNSGQRPEPEQHPCNIVGPSEDYDAANKMRPQDRKPEQQIQKSKSQDRLEKHEGAGRHNDAERNSLSPRKIRQREHSMYDHQRSSHERTQQRRNDDTSERSKGDVRQHDDAERGSPPPGWMKDMREHSPYNHPGSSRGRTQQGNDEDRCMRHPEDAEWSSPPPVRREREHAMIEHPGSSSRERTQQQGNYGQPCHGQWGQTSNKCNQQAWSRTHQNASLPRVHRGHTQNEGNARFNQMRYHQETLPLQFNDRQDREGYITFLEDCILSQRYEINDRRNSDHIPLSMLHQSHARSPLDLDKAHTRGVMEMQRGPPPHMDERR